MRRYKRFSVHDFIRDRKSWEKEIKDYREELESIRGLKSVEGGGRSNTISRPTENQALKCNQLEVSIARCEMYQKAWAYVERELSDREKELIKGFYESHYSIGRFVEEYARKYALNIRYVYRERRRMEEHIFNLMRDAGFDVL